MTKSKRTKDFIYHAAKLRGVPDWDCVAMAIFLSKWLEPKSPERLQPEKGENDV